MAAGIAKVEPDMGLRHLKNTMRLLDAIGYSAIEGPKPLESLYHWGQNYYPTPFFGITYIL